MPLFVAPAASIVSAALIGEDRALRLIDDRQAVDADLAGALDRIIHVGEGRAGGALVDRFVVKFDIVTVPAPVRPTLPLILRSVKSPADATQECRGW